MEYNTYKNLNYQLNSLTNSLNCNHHKIKEEMAFKIINKINDLIELIEEI